MSADELALREALVELFPLGLTDDAPARRRARVAKRRADRVAERRAAREAKLREDARRPVDTLVSLSSRPTRRDDSMPDNGAANRRESWADRVEREAREQADQLRTNIAETEATLTSLREEYAKVGAILTAIGAAVPPAPEPPVAAAPTPAAAPPEPPARRERETKHRPAALTDEEEAKLRAFAEDSGIFTVKRARELLDPEDNTPGPKKQAVSNFYHAMLADGTIARHGTPGSPYMFYTHRDYDGPVDLAVAKAQGAPAPVAEPPQPEPTPEPEPEPEPDGGALLAALAERGPLSTRDLRAMGIADVKEVADALAERGAVVFEREVRDGHGFPYVRLPDQALPEDAIATPSDATRATRRVEADPTTRRAANAAKQMGIFTIKRLDELLNGDRATSSTRANLSIVMKDLVAAGVARRYGPERGVGVYFTHVDYDGPLDLVIAKGEVSRQALAEEPVVEPEPEPEIAPAPVPTDMPPELAAMPAATRSGPLAPRIASARDQLKVYNAVARGPSVSGEVAKIAGLPTTRVTAYLRELEEAGLLRRTGVERRGRDQTLGRPGFEFEVAGPAAAPAAPAPAPEPPAPEPEPEPAGPAADEPKLEAVRDAVARWSGPITPGAVAIKHEWDLDVVDERLADLARRGILSDEGVEGAPVYVYVPPDGPGRAHSVQRASAPAPEAPSAPNGKGGTVAGTGRGQKVSNPDVRQLVDAAKKQGCKAVLAPNGHWRITTPDGRKVLISGTPKSSRTVETDRARLRRIGVNV
jgi:hypothetical protein